ncbi:hypothetical protein DM02DRAFT_618901 [Periconia macrospinosa]|uniref:Cyclase n=1 Tax=Periconia macrospinosa TaxID=97972 RepID=A0A2V1D7L5_9PLEO|nr:hypothetical protein DM02DRAFT_618901 [Periconia macrospinosa]
MDKTPTTIPWDPNCNKFPSRKELPSIPGAPEGAAWVWGEDDNIGRINLLTPTRVAAAAKEIKTGEIIPLNLPLNLPAQPAFNRQTFKHEIKAIMEGYAYDDTYELNTQSSTQWDGLRHCAHLPSGQFYNHTTATDIVGPNANNKCSIHYWADHGIAGRGILLDYRTYALQNNKPYDPYTYHRISHAELAACGHSQGLDIRPASQGGDIQIGDILFIRTGWKEAHDTLTPEARSKAALRHGSGKDGEDGQAYAGVGQEEEMIDWLHDCYFAAVAGDSPTFEAWPTHEKYHLHEFIVALWGMPLGEMLDLERLSGRCRELGRWTFFFTSAPANCVGGVGSHVNGTAIL